MTLAQQLKEYIQRELDSSALYRELAKTAPEQDAALLRELSADELRHARAFQSAYTALTGCSYTPKVNGIVPQGAYRDTLLGQVKQSCSDLRRYSQQTLGACKNDQTQNALLCAQQDKIVHALRLLAMAAEETQDQTEKE